jgi:hypothetical protein
MTDELIERVAKEIHISAFRDAPWPNGGHVAMQEKILREVKIVLSKIRPGDVLPNGCVVVPLEPNDLQLRLLHMFRNPESEFRALIKATKGDN